MLKATRKFFSGAFELSGLVHWEVSVVCVMGSYKVTPGPLILTHHAAMTGPPCIIPNLGTQFCQFTEHRHIFQTTLYLYHSCVYTFKCTFDSWGAFYPGIQLII